jgi:hypothetical protein
MARLGARACGDGVRDEGSGAVAWDQEYKNANARICEIRALTITNDMRGIDDDRFEVYQTRS